MEDKASHQKAGMGTVSELEIDRWVNEGGSSLPSENVPESAKFSELHRNKHTHVEDQDSV